MEAKRTEKENRTITRHVRITQSAYAWIMKADGATFNEKFNNLIDFCMTRELVLHNLEQDYKQRAEALRKQIDELAVLLQTHKDVRTSISRAYEAVNALYKNIDL